MRAMAENHFAKGYTFGMELDEDHSRLSSRAMATTDEVKHETEDATRLVAPDLGYD